MRVECLAQEHNTMTWPGLEPRPFDLVSSTLTIGPPHHSYQYMEGHGLDFCQGLAINEFNMSLKKIIYIYFL